MSVEPSRSGLEPDPRVPVVEEPGTAAAAPTPLGDRLVAIAEVTLCSGFPTQLGLIVLFTLVGAAPVTAAGQLSLSYIVLLTLADAALVLLLVWLLLRAHAERPVAAFVGTRGFGGEVLLGISAGQFLRSPSRGARGLQRPPFRGRKYPERAPSGKLSTPCLGGSGHVRGGAPISMQSLSEEKTSGS